MLAAILERDDAGIHAVVIDTTADVVLWITDSFKTAEEAERSALAWVDGYLFGNGSARSARPKNGTRSKRRCKRRRKG